MGYATVVAAARAALEIGNEATVDTGYVWVDKENMDDPEREGDALRIVFVRRKRMLYK